MVENSRRQDKKIKLGDLNLNILEQKVIRTLKTLETNAVKKAESIIRKFVEENV